MNIGYSIAWCSYWLMLASALVGFVRITLMEVIHDVLSVIELAIACIVPVQVFIVA